MRHRITSFRCVEAKVIMSPGEVQCKTCNVIQFRQSSMARVGSGQFGTTSGGAPATPTAKRDLLNARASSNLSNAGTSALTRAVAASYVAGIERAAELVHNCTVGDAALAGRIKITRRVARLHLTISCAVPLTSKKVASLAPCATPYVQLPGEAGELTGSAALCGAVGCASEEVERPSAISANIAVACVIVSGSTYRPWLEARQAHYATARPPLCSPCRLRRASWV